MTKLLEHAVDSVRALPPAVQDELARLLLQVAGEEQPVILLTLEERADLAEADAEIARGVAQCRDMIDEQSFAPLQEIDA